MKRTILLLFLFGIGLTGASCSNQAESKSDQTSTQPVEVASVNVKVEPVTTTTLTEYITSSGETLPEEEVTFAAEVPGRVEYLAADLGDEVKKGQVLAKIDYEMLKAQSEQAEANYELTQKTYNRLYSIGDSRFASQQQIDEARTHMVQAKAQLRITQINLDKSTITSTISGIVTRKFIEVGEYVGPGSPIFHIVNAKNLLVETTLAETQVVRVQQGSPAKIRIDALNEVFDSTIHTVIPAAMAPSKTYVARTKLANPDNKIYVGMAATLQIVAEVHENVITVSHDVVIEEIETRYVFVEENGVAKKRTVTLGAAQGNKVIIESGLQVGDKLIVLGHRELVDNQPVRVVES